MTVKALLVGVDDYAPVGMGGPDLQGCVNDVRDMAHTLNVLGIVPPRPGNLRILTNARATRANILAGLEWLVTEAKQGDGLIYYYSGHGSRMPDLDGDEVDKKDETICPHDYDTAGMIRDDDLRGVLESLPAGVNMEVLLDSCHSGTMTKEIGEQAVRYVAPPLDYGYFLDADPTLAVQGILRIPAETSPSETKTRAAVTVPGLNHVLWTACRDYQVAMEIPVNGIRRGVFTYCFCKVLRKAGVEITRRKLDALVSEYIKELIKRMGYGYIQVPQLEGAEAAIEEQVFT